MNTQLNNPPDTMTDRSNNTNHEHDLEDEASEAQPSSIHPLMIEHVAKEVFSFFNWSYSQKDLLSCRQVCKEWSKIITNMVKKKGNAPKIILKYDGTSRLDDFIDIMSHTANLPFDSFTLDKDFFIRRHTNLCSYFLNSFSSYMTNLSLIIGKDFSLDFQSLVCDSLNFSNLKCLSLKFSHLSTMPDQEILSSSCTWLQKHPKYQLDGLIFLLTVLLKSANQLESLELHLPCKYIEGDCQNFGNMEIGNLLAGHVSKTVTNLQLLMRLNEDHLNSLSKLNLKKLRLEYYGSQLSRSNLTNFLQKQSDTLTYLRIVDLETLSASWNQVFPKFRKLTSLEIKSSEFYTLDPTCIEELKTLILFSPLMTQRGPENKVFISKSVKEICLNFIVESNEIIRDIPSYFPNVSVCRVNVSQDSQLALGKIFELLVNLKEVQLTFLYMDKRYYVDPILTGLPSAKCSYIAENGIYEGYGQSVLLQETQRKPCLENLRYLESLILNITSPEILFTDVSVFYAIFRSPLLRRLKLEGCHNISSECLDLLKLRFQFKNDATQMNIHRPSTLSMALAPFPLREGQ